MITAASARELYSYDPETGFLTNKKRRRGVRSGARAGRVRRDGYRSVIVNHAEILEHRLIWLIFHGQFPQQQIDHINRIRWDNRIANLRDVSGAENLLNRDCATPPAWFVSSRFKACTGLYHVKWRKRTKGHNREFQVGVFRTKEEADVAAAYTRQAVKRLWPDKPTSRAQLLALIRREIGSNSALHKKPDPKGRKG